jgi:hypothetical protein
MKPFVITFLPASLNSQLKGTTFFYHSPETYSRLFVVFLQPKAQSSKPVILSSFGAPMPGEITYGKFPTMKKVPSKKSALISRIKVLVDIIIIKMTKCSVMKWLEVK